MKQCAILIISVFVLCLVQGVFGASAPVVSNVAASQRSGDSKLVDIYYDLTDTDGDTCSVWFKVSTDSGASWQIMPKSAYGDVWANVMPGTYKHITWDAGADIPGFAGNFKVRLFADDGNSFAQLCFVPYDPQTGYGIDDFWIGKYEVTNAQYCEFLNQYDPSGSYYYSGMQINQYGSAGSYYYQVQPGKVDYPIVYTAFADAQAFCQWLSNETGLTYRLPSGNEWEMAAGWDPINHKLWTYGCQQDTIDCTWCNYSPCYPILPVGYFNGINPGTNDAKSYYGCYDMSGNVSEWTTDIDNGERCQRGGSTSSSATECQVTFLSFIDPTQYHGERGFRIVLDLN